MIIPTWNRYSKLFLKLKNGLSYVSKRILINIKILSSDMEYAIIIIEETILLSSRSQMIKIK